MKEDIEVPERHCQNCNKVLPAQMRKDAKFCKTYCRTEFNNQRRFGLHPDVVKVDKLLHKNYEILAHLLIDKKYVVAGKEYVIVPRTILDKKGFRMDFHTQTRGKEYRYCYNLSFRETTDNKVLIGRAPDHVLNEQV